MLVHQIESGLHKRQGQALAEMRRKTELPLYDLLHEFNAHQNSARVIETLEAEHRLRAEFYAPVVLFEHIVQILTTANLDRIGPAIIEFIPHPHDA